MTKRIQLFLIVATIAALCSCNKGSAVEEPTDNPINDPVENQDVKPEDEELVFTARIEGNIGTKTTLTEDMMVNWDAESDKISINGVTFKVSSISDSGEASFIKDDTQSDPTGTYKAYYPSDLWNGEAGTLPAEQIYADGKISNLPMYAESTTTQLEFKNICAVLAVTVPNSQLSDVSRIDVLSDLQLNGAFTATAEGTLSFVEKSLTEEDQRVSLVFPSPISISTEKTFYIAIPAGVHDPLIINVSNGDATKVMTTRKDGGVQMNRNTIYPVTFTDNSLEGALPAVFTVDDSGKKVRFSRGNLMYNGTGFAFEANQYDYRTWEDSGACINGVKCNTPEANVGLFYFNRSKDDAILQAYRKETDSAGSDSRSINDVLFTNTDDSVIGSEWRALTADEWKYILADREGAQTTKSGYATVCGVAGLIILPDCFTDPGTNEATSASEGSFVGGVPVDTYGNNIYSGKNWLALEAAGAIFLPACGSRSGSGGVTDVGKAGQYLSTTSVGKSSEFKIKCVQFTGAKFASQTQLGRNYAKSIRLVTEQL